MVCSGRTTRIADVGAESQPEADDQQRQRPLHLGSGVVAEPEEIHADDDRRGARQQRIEQDLLVVA